MNILISSAHHAWNAEAHYAAILAEELKAAGHGVWLLAQADSPHEKNLKKRGLTPLTGIVPLRGLFSWWQALRKIKRLCAENKIDVVNVFRSEEFIFHLLAAKTLTLPVVRTRGLARPVRGGWFNRQLYGKWSDALVVSSSGVRTNILQTLNLPPDQIETIYFPTDLPKVLSREQKAAGKAEFLAELGIKGNPVLLGIVARLTPDKGHTHLIEALPQMAESNALLVILAKSNPDEEPMRKKLEELVAAKGLADRVKFLGFRADVRQLMGWMDAGVVVSLSSEMNCRVAVEFFSMGTPIVAYPTGALPEVVAHQKSGLLTQSHDPAQLAQALDQMVADVPLRTKLSVGARKAAETRFSRADFLARHLEVMGKAIERKAKT